jgi:hypothetical protein
MVEHSLGSPAGLEADCMLAAGLVLPRGLAVADWPVLLRSSLSPHLAQYCPPWSKNGGVGAQLRVRLRQNAGSREWPSSCCSTIA